MIANIGKQSYGFASAILFVICFAIVVSATSVPTKSIKPRIASQNVKGSHSINRARIAKDESKFQARMLSSDQQVRQDQGETFVGASESWQAHSLVPTFTDQEQGDEMVALASETEQEPSRFIPANKSLTAQQTSLKSLYREHEHSSPAYNDKNRDAGEGSRSISKNKAQLEEYYSDDEEDEEEPMKSIRTDFDQSSGEERERDNKSRNAGSLADNQYGDLSGSTIQDVSQKAAEIRGEQLNKSAKVSTQENGWLPSSGNANKLEVQSSTRQHASQKHPGGSQQVIGERLAGFLGRDSANPFSRANVAIEYLKNILKSRQNTSGDPLSEEGSKHLEDPSKITLSKHFEQVQKPTDSSTGKNYTEVKAEHFVGEAKQTDYRANLPVNLNGLKSLLQQQTEGKFSIVDAKPIGSNPESVYQSQNRQQASSTTKLPSESHSILLQNPSDAFKLNQQVDLPHPHESLSINGSPIGTPLGGDYVESLDEFPRGANQQQTSQNHHLYQQHQQQAVVAESQQNSIIYRDHHEDRLPIQSEQSLHSKIQDQPGQQQQVSIENARLYNNFQSQSSNYQLPVASSSRFFRLEQPISESVPAEQPKTHFGEGYRGQKGNKETVTPQQHKIIKESSDSSQDSVNKTAQLVDKTYHKQHKIEQPKKLDLSVHNHQVQQQQQMKKSPIERPISQQDPIQNAQPQQPQLPSNLQVSISSKLYRGEQPIKQEAQPSSKQQQPPVATQPQLMPHIPSPKGRPPKIVSYNYFESGPSESGESEMVATNYQLGDALYGSNGGVEQLLSNTELEAIQNQFMTAEHPIVPVSNDQTIIHDKAQSNLENDANLAGLLANLKPNNYQSDTLQKLQSQINQNEDTLRELASNEAQVRVAAPTSTSSARPKLSDLLDHRTNGQQVTGRTNDGLKSQDVEKKKKSLVVYLNHPRQADMSKVADPYSLAQSIGEQSTDSFISAKEFDSHGLSKDSKYLDVSNLRGLGDLREGQDKDGLSVVVIGDAYKYKKIVLLISSRSGGLKFIPMVKDMRKK